MVWGSEVHESIWSDLPQSEHEAARAAMKELLRSKNPRDEKQVETVENCRIRGTYRLRVGRYRI